MATRKFEIFYSDLTPDAKMELCRELNTDAEDENWDCIALAIIEREEEEEKEGE